MHSSIAYVCQWDKPLDLFCGLGGWSEGLLAEGWRVFGFDIERHVYGEHRYPAQLVIQDVRSLHGSQFKNADLIVASPPCQEFSYMAMPWTRAKAKAATIRADTSGAERARLTSLFDACFRIQREACEAAGRHIPLIVENVRGAQPWVGRAQGSFGSFYLWGDVPALMPVMTRASKVSGFRFDGSGGSFQTASMKMTYRRDGAPHTKHLTNQPRSHGFNVTAAQRYRAGLTESRDGVKHCGSGAEWWRFGPGSQSSKSDSRKAASAMIAKIPLILGRHIGRVLYPRAEITLRWLA